MVEDDDPFDNRSINDAPVDDGSVDNESVDDSVAFSISDVLRERQFRIEKMKSDLDSLCAFVHSSADSDLSGDYDGAREKKRSFLDLVDAERDDIEQPRVDANNLLYGLQEYLGMLQRTKAFHCK